MKKLLIISLITLCISAPITCSRVGEAFDKALDGFIDQKVDQANGKLDKVLDRASTNGIIKFGGLVLAYLFANHFLFPELNTYCDDKNDDQPGQTKKVNRTKVALGITGILAGLGLAFGSDRISDYVHKSK